MTSKYLIELLYQSFDRELKSDEDKILKEGLNSSDELRTLRKQIIAMRELTESSAEYDFNAGFEAKVMRSINGRLNQDNQTGNLASLLSLSFSRVAISAAILLAILTTYNVGTGNSSLIDNIFGAQGTSIETVYSPASQLNMELIQQNN